MEEGGKIEEAGQAGARAVCIVCMWYEDKDRAIFCHLRHDSHERKSPTTTTQATNTDARTTT